MSKRFELPDGHKVYITHARRMRDEDGGTFVGTKELLIPGDEVLPQGGVTVADIVDEEGNVVASGSAFCSVRDNFSKRIGRDIATGRALKELHSGNFTYLRIA